MFSLGLAATVAPLTAAVLADADEENAGIASGVNNAIARVASLMAIAAVGAVVASAFTSSIDASLAGVPLTPKAQRAVARRQGPDLRAGRHGRAAAAPGRRRRERRPGRVGARRSTSGWAISAALVALGGLLGLVFIVNPGARRAREGCAGGQIAGVPEELAAAPTSSGSRSRPESS